VAGEEARQDREARAAARARSGAVRVQGTAAIGKRRRDATGDLEAVWVARGVRRVRLRSEARRALVRARTERRGQVDAVEDGGRTRAVRLGRGEARGELEARVFLAERVGS